LTCGLQQHARLVAPPGAHMGHTALTDKISDGV
jgi:hypothetical protein